MGGRGRRARGTFLNPASTAMCPATACVATTVMSSGMPSISGFSRSATSRSRLLRAPIAERR